MLARRGIPLFRRLYGEEAVATRTLRPGRRSESFSRIACEAMGGEGAGAPDRARAGDGGGVTALGSYSRCQTARRIANSFVGWVERLRNPSMGFAPLRGPQPILRTIPARHLLSATSSPSFSFPSASRAEHFRFFHPGRGGGERRRALRMPARHPGSRAMTGTQAPQLRRLAFSATRTLASRRSTVAIFGPCPCSPLSGIPSGVVRRPCSPHGSYCPEDRVSWTSRGKGATPAGDATPRSTSRPPHEAPLDERG